MKKAIYVTPIIEIHRIEPPVIMAGSDPNSIPIDVDDSNNLFDGTFRSKQNKKGLWDEDE
ncbi:hypothetical protein [uncultured Prevotella sp.]|uniref:hypothetical protein n=1 Tax=uncultured Prevotella sp. TaxID=159272 RepID=UPI00259A1235|nr:hypothetical protein [uncultured Prevotella sp.]